MNKRELSTLFLKVYENLAPSKVSVFVKTEDSTINRVVSETFNGMTFSSRIKLLNDQLQKQQADIFNEKIYIFEAFTSAEVGQISLDSLTI